MNIKRGTYTGKEYLLLLAQEIRDTRKAITTAYGDNQKFLEQELEELVNQRRAIQRSIRRHGQDCTVKVIAGL